MIGLHLEGSGASLEGLRDAIEAMAEPHTLVLEVDEPELHVTLHPAAEAVRLVVSEEGRVTLDAHTVTAGPGYHRAVVAFAESLGVQWEAGGDDTGWRESRDDDALEERFLDWLGAAAAQILEWASEGGVGFALAMPAHVRFDSGGVVATQLGPRDRAWLEATRADARVGIDVFPWWGTAKGALYFRELARVVMWSSVRWRPPVNEEEHELMEQAATWIELAHGFDPELELPWAEQAEILGYLEEESLRATRAQLKAQTHEPPSIGYRRRPVQVQLSGGWRITIPGELAERWEERGTWVGWDSTRSVWFNSLTVSDEDGQPSPNTEATLAKLPPLEGDEILELERDELLGYASFTEEVKDDQTLYRLAAHAAVDEHAAIGTLVFVEPGDREWALATWGSLVRG